MSQLTIEDIATLAGVSRSTVSRVLNSHPSVRPTVRDRVWQVINAHGYAPQAAARQLVTQRTRVIGVLLPDNAYHLPGNPIFVSIGQGISQVCAQHGYTSMLFLGRLNMQEEVLLTLLRSRHFDGIVLISSDRHDTLPAFLQKTRIPYVRIGHDPESEDLKFVDVDNTTGAYTAVQHLISLGHQRIALIKGLTRDVCTPARYEGYSLALQEAGLPLDPELVGEGDWSVASGYATMQHFLQLDQPPDAVFSTNDMMAAGVLHAMNEHGLRAPTDIAIVSFDDLPQTTMIFPALTTISQPSIEIGIRATEILIEQLEDENYEPRHVILPTTLVIRQSCGANTQSPLFSTLS